MIQTLNTWLIRVFCVFWALFLFIDYANNSGYLTQAFSYFEYHGLIIAYIILSAGIVFIFAKRKNKSPTLIISNYRNVYSYLFLLFSMALIMLFYLNQTDITASKGSGVISFLVKTLGFHISLIPILAATFSTGSFLVQRTGITLHAGSGFFIHLATGFFVLTLLLFLMGAAGILQPLFIFPLLILLIIPGWRNLVALGKNHLFNKIQSFELHVMGLFPFIFIIFLIALNLCFITRPFPIGFDDLNLYMNIPKLIAGYGALTEGGDAYNWSIIMSLGFILYKSAGIAMLLSVVPGIFSIIILYMTSRKLSVSREWSLLACALFYTLPNIIWQSRNDAKVDLALLFITLSAFLLIIEYFFLSDKKEGQKLSLLKFLTREQLVWTLCGFLVGFAFGIKYTSLLCIFAFAVIAFYISAGRLAATGMFFMTFAIIFGLKLTRFAAFDTDSVFLTITPLLLSLLFFGLAVRKNKHSVLIPAKSILIFSLAMALTFIPWAIKNISENGSFSFSSVLTGKSPLPILYPEMKGETTGFKVRDRGKKIIPEKTPEINSIQNNDKKINFSGINLLSPLSVSKKLIAQASDSTSKTTARPAEKRDARYTDKYEEIRRYLGYEKGFIRFISLPYDLAMKTNVRLWSADTGILMLILIPLLMFTYKEKPLIVNLLKMVLILYLLTVSIVSVWINAGPFELDNILQQTENTSFIDSPTFKSLLLPAYMLMKKGFLIAGNSLMPLYKLLSFQTVGFSFMLVMFSAFLFYALYKQVIKLQDSKSKVLIAFTFCILICWMILSSGIFWYGMTGFALLMIVITAMTYQQIKAGHANSEFTGAFVASCAIIWITLIIPFQFMPVKFTLVKDMTQVDFKGFIDRPFAKYAIGASNEKEVFRQFFQPAEQNIIHTLNSDKKAGVLNVSTFLTYHIINNDSRVYVDNQLGIFDRVYRKSNADKQEVLNEFKRKGIKYILVSLYTPTLDMTPEKSLTKKYTNMMQLLVNNPGAKLLYTNRVVERPDGNLNWNYQGKPVRAMYHLAGMRLLNQGSVAMFEII